MQIVQKTSIQNSGKSNLKPHFEKTHPIVYGKDLRGRRADSDTGTVERLFSDSGNILSKKRKRLGASSRESSVLKN